MGVAQCRLTRMVAKSQTRENTISDNMLLFFKWRTRATLVQWRKKESNMVYYYCPGVAAIVMFAAVCWKEDDSAVIDHSQRTYQRSTKKYGSIPLHALDCLLPAASSYYPLTFE